MHTVIIYTNVKTIKFKFFIVLEREGQWPKNITYSLYVLNTAYFKFLHWLLKGGGGCFNPYSLHVRLQDPVHVFLAACCLCVYFNVCFSYKFLFYYNKQKHI